MSKLRFYENIHILFWLIKDLSWVMIWKPLGIAMILPTIGFAVWFCIKSFYESEFFVHLATLFWILANALWMLMEFYDKEEYKFVAAIIFIAGLVSVSYYIIKEFKEEGKNLY
ncbi:MAG: hypothetical protein N2203_02965 [Bacteroidia bacterium]|nr:hypothetical protein [Bacteroidia bacterium]